jgi:HSP20 family protein
VSGIVFWHDFLQLLRVNKIINLKNRRFLTMNNCLVKRNYFDRDFNSLAKFWTDIFFEPDSNIFRSAGMSLSSKDENGYTLNYLCAGVDKKDIEVLAENGILSVKNKSENKQYSFEDFKLELPDDVNTDKIDAKLENGILTIKIPLKEETKKQKASKIIKIE